MITAAARSWTLDALLAELTDQAVPSLPVSGICLDSRLVQSGDVYLAVGGASTHGMRFAADAVAAGAVAVLLSTDAEPEHVSRVHTLRSDGVPVLTIDDLDKRCAFLASRYYEDPDRSMTLIAVTGTDGKSSVCRFIAQAFSAIDQPCGYIGTLGWGLGEQLQSTELTTPDAVTLRRMLASMRERGATRVALEASSHALAEGRLDGLSLDVAVLTNLGRDHLDYHKTLDAYREAKARLFSWPDLSAIVVNGCDEFGRHLLDRVTVSRRFAYFPHEQQLPASDSLNDELHVIRATEVVTNATGLQFCLQEEGMRSVVRSALLGRFNVDNMLACYASLRACGVAANQACHSLSAITPVAGRMERFGQADRPTVVVDFSHTPQALRVAIDAARVHCSGQLWVVFGCGGDRDPGKRAPMAAAAEAADQVVLTDDNPRTERSEDIIKDALKGFREPQAVTIIADRALAIAHAIQAADSKDLVLIAGKGHEDYQIVGTTRHPFSDREQVLAALERAS